MSASEQPQDEARREPEEDKARNPVGQPRGDGHELPLFLRDISDGQKGNAQDEKDEMAE
ncbi:MAG TPA: hypothetical protein VFZ44_16695 [Pyrinomonadaceae bacterium]